MKIVFLKDLAKVGRKGEIKEIADGYARNFLIPQKLVEPATEGVLKRIEENQEVQKKEIAREVMEFEEFKKKLSQKSKIGIKISKTADNKGGLYGALSKEDITTTLRSAGLTLPGKTELKISEPIKTTGHHKLTVIGPQNKDVVFNIEVVAEKEKKTKKSKA